MPEPRYKVILRRSGDIKVMRSDGDDCSLAEVEWLKSLMTRSLREAKLVQNPNFRGYKEKIALQKGTTRRGETFTVDPIIHELEAERERQGLSRAAVAAALFDDDARLGSYARGRARPQMQLLRLWAYVLGLVVITVPKELERQIRAMIEEWRGELVDELPKVEIEVEAA